MSGAPTLGGILGTVAGTNPPMPAQKNGNLGDILNTVAGGASSSNNGAVDWAALAQLAAAGLTASDVQALAAAQNQSGGGAGLTSDAAPTDPFANNPGTVTPAAIQQVQQLYPSLAWMLNIPELNSVIINAASTGEDSAQLTAQIQSTRWWQSQSSSARSFFQEEMSGSAVDARNTLNTAVSSIQQSLGQLGLEASQNQVNTLAWQSMVNAWSPTQTLQQLGNSIVVNQDGSFTLTGSDKGLSYSTVQMGTQGGPVDWNALSQMSAAGMSPDQIRALASQTIVTGLNEGGGPVDWSALEQMQAAGLTASDVQALGAAQGVQTPQGPEGMSGALQSLEQTLGSLSKQYLVNTNPQNLGEWVKSAVINGQSAQQAEQGFQAYLQNTAIAQFPWMQQGIQAGQTPLQLVSPYANMVSNELGISPNNIDWTQPQWSKLLSAPDPKTGVPTQNPIWQATQQVRSDPTYGWSKTPDAISAAYNFVQGMQETMGQRSYGGQTPGNVAMSQAYGSSGG